MYNDNLEKHLKPGSFITTYSDTDSIALALTKTDSSILSGGGGETVKLADKINAMFGPILRDDKKEVCVTFVTL